MLLGPVRALEAHHRAAHPDALHEPQPLELVEDAVDARAAHPAPAPGPQRVLDLERAQRARLPAEQLEQRAARAAALEARLRERRARVLDPGLAHLPTSPATG
jgi:hypothetical protein